MPERIGKGVLPASTVHRHAPEADTRVAVAALRNFHQMRRDDKQSRWCLCETVNQQRRCIDRILRVGAAKHFVQ